MGRLDRAEVVKRLQDRLDKHSSKEDRTAYNNGVIDSLDYALFLLELLDITEQGKEVQQEQQQKDKE